jgi:hypothetical protein
MDLDPNQDSSFPTILNLSRPGHIVEALGKDGGTFGRLLMPEPRSLEVLKLWAMDDLLYRPAATLTV